MASPRNKGWFFTCLLVLVAFASGFSLGRNRHRQPGSASLQAANVRTNQWDASPLKLAADVYPQNQAEERVLSFEEVRNAIGRFGKINLKQRYEAAAKLVPRVLPTDIGPVL